MSLYQIIRPEKIVHPIVLSVPHAGTDFPEDLKSQFKAELLPPDDTDWFVNDLYGFAQEMGIVLITANISRWVIDLNRHPESEPLYHDGRVITALCTTTDFLGNPIYVDEREIVEKEDAESRKKLYFEPYHLALNELLKEVKSQFGKVLLWDCHSIRRNVPSIRQEPFPDLILGSADETSADKRLIDIVLENLSKGEYKVSHNEPFKGGYITRNYGRPDENIHALQLEMSKDLYLDDNEADYNEFKAKYVEILLKNTLHELSVNL